MWTRQGCILTTKDFTILEFLQERRHRFSEAYATLLRAKLDGATVIFREDVPANVTTLNSRVRYRINDEAPQSRIISHEELQGFVGLTLPLTTLRGLALLGLSAGDRLVLPHEGTDTPDRITLEEVVYQPESARRKMGASSQPRPALRLVHSAEAPAMAQPTFIAPGGDDDPGPSAA
ncbi:nucleoside-diphosphate kinase [Nitratireductor sp. GZWM139]|uniref:nucleoside-diphosphate kinase n=1 Tax=Nitratireductor sp. GZWM139 TaxID=2950541 RepID=UPI0024BDB52B|nr:nucleoside-diphosphate kinase [Nitratireductor sp. GZWM139]MDJ1462398.1 nucleoside-diphosphate kinase [Nitratireductor sp. GZWM139]